MIVYVAKAWAVTVPGKTLNRASLDPRPYRLQFLLFLDSKVEQLDSNFIATY